MPNFVGGFPPAVKPGGSSGTDISTVADSVQAPIELGHVAVVNDSSARWSLVKYYKAGASIAQGDALMVDTSARSPNQFIKAATTQAGQNRCRGIAAAEVSNTSFFSWCYIAGYCPTIGFNSGYASNQIFGLSATTAGKLSSHGFNTGPATGLATANNFAFVWSLGAESTGTAATDVFAVNSGIISPWLF